MPGLPSALALVPCSFKLPLRLTPCPRVQPVLAFSPLLGIGQACPIVILAANLDMPCQSPSSVYGHHSQSTYLLQLLPQRDYTDPALVRHHVVPGVVAAVLVKSHHIWSFTHRGFVSWRKILLKSGKEMSMHLAYGLLSWDGRGIKANGTPEHAAAAWSNHVAASQETFQREGSTTPAHALCLCAMPYQDSISSQLHCVENICTWDPRQTPLVICIR